jgi:hypothetical protein
MPTDRSDQSGAPAKAGARLVRYPEWLQKCEEDAIDQRRETVRAAERDVGAELPRVGLALSGGGIRSATFSLGVLQALAKQKLLPRIDYLSTVSGGGYIGSFLGALYARGRSVREVESVLTRFPEAPEFKWLRDNGRFLAPNGAGANWLAGAVLLRNWVSLLVVLAPAAFFVSFLALGLRMGIDQIPWTLTSTEWSEPLRCISEPCATPPAATPSATFCVSPLWMLPAVVGLWWVVPCGLAYWLVRSGQSESVPLKVARAAWCLQAFCAGASFCYWLLHVHALFALALAGVLALSLIVFMVAAWDHLSEDPDSIARNQLSQWLESGLIVAALACVIALVDSLSCSAFSAWRAGLLTVSLKALGALASAIGSAVLGTHRLLAILHTPREGSRARLPLALISMVMGSALLLVGATFVGALGYLLVAPQCPGACGLCPVTGFEGVGAACKPQPWAWLSGLVIAGAGMWLLGRFRVFVNLSSLSTIYAARLTRAYVGASNPNRAPDSKQEGHDSPIEPIPGDQLAWKDYQPQKCGGPLHLINVTINETVDPRVQLHQPDRHGLTMAVGPHGVSVGVRHHAPWSVEKLCQGARLAEDSAPSEPGFHLFPPGGDLSKAEQPAVGRWVAISGAAVSTGLGTRTLWGLSVLLGVLNVRLGYWWNSAVRPDQSRRARALGLDQRLMQIWGERFPVYRYLLAEFLARFPGTAIDHWYLTDGGHSENTGCYELIRRRLPFIVCCDCGADPDLQFADIANLVRLVRVDFGAEVEFLDESKLTALIDPTVRHYFAPLDSFRGNGGSSAPMAGLGAPASALRGAYAALARIRYETPRNNDVTSWLLVLKPHLIGEEALDITQYQSEHEDFPQQSTGDQSFDDAQWESYRKLGSHAASRVFASSETLEKPEKPEKWLPSWLDQAALDRLEEAWRAAPPRAG